MPPLHSLFPSFSRFAIGATAGSIRGQPSTQQPNVGSIEVGAAVAPFPDVITDQSNLVPIVVVGSAAVLASTTAFRDHLRNELAPSRRGVEIVEDLQRHRESRRHGAQSRGQVMQAASYHLQLDPDELRFLAFPVPKPGIVSKTGGEQNPTNCVPVPAGDSEAINEALEHRRLPVADDRGVKVIVNRGIAPFVTANPDNSITAPSALADVFVMRVCHLIPEWVSTPPVAEECYDALTTSLGPFGGSISPSNSPDRPAVCAAA